MADDGSAIARGPTIALKDTLPLCIDFHPTQDLLAVSTITGEVNCYAYTGESTKRQFSSKHHKDSVRSVKFSADGAQLYSGSVDKSVQIMDVSTKQVIAKKAKAHEHAINTILPLSDHVVASGDEDGVVQIWDLRAKSVVQTWHEHEQESVTAMHWVPHKKTLVSVGGDGYLAVYDIRKQDVVARSDQMETELLSIAPVKGGSTVCVGQADGTIGLWKWGWWGDMKDRFPGHPGGVESLVALADDLVVSGCSDGMIRVLSIFPNKLLGVVGEHEDFPVESLAASHDKKWLASCSHDATVQLWSLAFLDDNDDDDEQIQESDQEGDYEEEEEEDVVETLADGNEEWESVSGSGDDADGWESASDADAEAEAADDAAPPAAPVDSDADDSDDDSDAEPKTAEDVAKALFEDSDDGGDGAALDDSDSDEDTGAEAKKKRKKKKHVLASAFQSAKKAKVERPPQQQQGKQKKRR
ncbi:WD repeat-containing protein jip5 [Blastocladiella emersonii ATCC 22665]|nr:WD repeat-containing protein jip5 [Blastocladiella emersonii ATCC 22665]